MKRYNAPITVKSKIKETSIKTRLNDCPKTRILNGARKYFFSLVNELKEKFVVIFGLKDKVLKTKLNTILS